MEAKVGNIVRPWYKGTHEWQVKAVAELEKPIEYSDPVQHEVRYDPKVLSLENSEGQKSLWFTYWISTGKTKGKLKWGQGSPMLEEGVFLKLLQGAIRQGLFGKNFLTELNKELELALKE